MLPAWTAALVTRCALRVVMPTASSIPHPASIQTWSGGLDHARVPVPKQVQRGQPRCGAVGQVVLTEGDGHGEGADDGQRGEEAAGGAATEGGQQRMHEHRVDAPQQQDRGERAVAVNQLLVQPLDRGHLLHALDQHEIR